MTKEALLQAQKLLRGLTFKDTRITNALESISRALRALEDTQ